MKGTEEAMTEADAAALLMERSKSMRTRFLIGSLVLSFAAGALFAWSYISTAFRIFGIVMGAAFAVGALLMFVVTRFVTGLVMRGMEAAWAADLARKSGVSAQALKDALHMLR
ncbi:MAG: hypothetical protein R3B70_21785 [Polyangiaceae bacterium]